MSHHMDVHRLVSSLWAEPIWELPVGGMEGRWDVGEMEIGV